MDKEYLKRDLDENYNFYPGQQDFWIDTFLCFSFIRSKHELKDRRFMKWNIFPLFLFFLFMKMNIYGYFPFHREKIDNICHDWKSRDRSNLRIYWFISRNKGIILTVDPSQKTSADTTCGHLLIPAKMRTLPQTASPSLLPSHLLSINTPVKLLFWFCHRRKENSFEAFSLENIIWKAALTRLQRIVVILSSPTPELRASTDENFPVSDAWYHSPSLSLFHFYLPC